MTTVDPRKVRDHLWEPVKASPLLVTRPWVLARRTKSGDIELHRGASRYPVQRRRAVIRFKYYDHAMARAACLNRYDGLVPS